MNQEECAKADDYRAGKKLKAEKEKEEADANKWWEENSKRFQNMNVKDCHDFLQQISDNKDVRPQVYRILLARLRQWKGDPPPPPPPPPPKQKCIHGCCKL